MRSIFIALCFVPNNDREHRFARWFCSESIQRVLLFMSYFCWYSTFNLYDDLVGKNVVARLRVSESAVMWLSCTSSESSISMAVGLLNLMLICSRAQNLNSICWNLSTRLPQPQQFFLLKWIGRSRAALMYLALSTAHTHTRNAYTQHTTHTRAKALAEPPQNQYIHKYTSHNIHAC